MTFISPCILPMLPIYFLYLAGTSEQGTAQGDRQGGGVPGQKNRILTNSAGFVTGFTLIFVVLGAAASFLGSFLNENRLLLQRISGLILILFGLNFTGLIKIGFLNMEKRFQFQVHRLNFIKSVLFGIVFGFGWTPCLGAFLGSALLLAGNSGTVLNGILLLLVYSVGLGIPFLISSVVFENIKGAFTWLNRRSRLIGILSGLLLAIAGLLIFLDVLKYL